MRDRMWRINAALSAIVFAAIAVGIIVVCGGVLWTPEKLGGGAGALPLAFALQLAGALASLVQLGVSHRQAATRRGSSLLVVGLAIAAIATVSLWPGIDAAPIAKTAQALMVPGMVLVLAVQAVMALGARPASA